MEIIKEQRPLMKKIKAIFSEHGEKSLCTKYRTIINKLNNYNFALSIYKNNRNKWNNYIKILERTHEKIN